VWSGYLSLRTWEGAMVDFSTALRGGREVRRRSQLNGKAIAVGRVIGGLTTAISDKPGSDRHNSPAIST
jgi:hypothetical protein